MENTDLNRANSDPTLVDYETGWDYWDDMVRYSPAPYHRRRLLLKAARNLGFATVLDVGCGNGETIAAFSQRFSANYCGVDLSRSVIEANRIRFPNVEFQQMDLAQECLDRTFDLVICSEVLEHCEQAPVALEHLRRMSAGHLLLTVPGGPVFTIDRSVGHHRHFHPRELESLLISAGFEPLSILSWGFPFHTLYKLLINASPGRAMEQFAGGSYGRTQKIVGLAVRTLFHANFPRLGWQLIVHARAS